MKRRGRIIRAVLFVAVLAVIGAVMLPTRLWFDQRHDVEQANEQLQDLRRSNAALEAKVAKLGSSSAIEQQARVDFGYVKPGEESYTLTAPPPPTLDLPDVWPFNLLQEPLTKASRSSH